MNTKFKILRIGYRQYRAFRQFMRLSNTERNSSTIPEEMVSDILELGATFIKLGQILSTRPDVLPPQYIAILESLQEDVPSFPFSDAERIIERELGKPVDKLFSDVEQKPVASASLSQVHFATLLSGEEVALKVQRPGIKSRIRHDLKLLEGLLNTARFFFPKKIARTNLQGGFAEFKRYTLQELDFAHEGETIQRFQNNFRDWPDIHFPKVYWDFTTERILTMERISGLRLKEATQKLSKEKRHQVNVRLAEMELKMFISDGLFHADLHPGNIFFREDGTIALLDFGMYGKLTSEERDRFVLYWLAVVQNQVRRAFYHFKKQCTELPGADEQAFYEEFKKLANQFYKSRLVEVSITKVYLNMIRAGYRYGFRFPSNLLLHAKALTTAESLTFELAPEARFEEITKPIIAKEFARLVLDENRLRDRIINSLPELLLTGETDLPGGSTLPSSVGAGRLLITAFYDQIVPILSKRFSQAGLFQSLLNHPARNVLSKEMTSAEIDQVIKNTWAEYARIVVDLPKQQTLGATFTLYLGAATIAMYKSLVQAGKTKEASTALIYRIGWKIYTRMGEIPMLFAGIFSDDPVKKMELATQIFRRFPFSAPDYEWEDVEAGKNVVAFNCNRCHVAELFEAFGLTDVCYHTWCKLDFPLAKQWGGELKRSNSIAGGADKCDFRWIVNTEEETKSDTYD